MMGSESSAAKSAPYFVSSLSSKCVPENGEVAFSCKITGNPKPDITWCKNGKDIKELEDFSNLEIMEDNLIHTLRLFCCTEQHAGVYRIVASNCFGRVQSSAFLKVTAGAKPDIYKTSHDRPKNNTRTCRASDVTTHHWESSNQAIGNNEDLEEKNDSIHEGFFSLESSEPPASELNVLSTDQTLFFYRPEYGFCPSMENQPKHTHCLEDSMHVKNLLGPEENNCSPLDASQNTSDPLMHDSLEMSGVCTETETSGDCSEREVDTVSSSQVDSKPASQINDHANSCSFNAEDLAACQTTEYAKTYEGSGLSKVLGKGTPSWSHAGIPLENQPCCLEESDKNAGHRSELLPDRTVVTADDSIGNDCLEDVERPDVMTEETSQEWEKRLEFLLESDDEDELKLGKECDGCAYFLGKMPRLLQVSGDTVPMDATIGFFGHQSKSREVAVRAYRTSPPEMTLTVGQQQSKAPDIKEKEKYMQPVASTVIENDYPRIEEANSSGGQATENSSLVQSRSMDKETLGIKLSSCGLSGPSAAIEKQDADRTFSWGNSPKFERVREKTTKGKDKGNIGAPMKTSKYLLYKLRPKEANASEIRTIRRKSRCLDSAVLLHGCKSGQASQDTSNSSTHSGFLHGEGGEEYNSQEGKRMSSLSEGNQWPNQSAGLEPQDPEAETTGPIGDELKLFITEPELENGFDSTSSAQAKNISAAAEKTAWEEVTGNNGFQRDNATLGNSTDLNLSSPTHAVGQQEPCPSSQTLQVTMTGGTVSHHVLLETLSHTPSTSHQEGLCDILTVPDRQMKGGIAGRTEPHEINEVKTIDDSPCAGQLSGVDFQAALECSKPKAKESVLSLLHKQLRDLLYEEEKWDSDLTCAGREVKSLPAGSDPAKEAEELNRAGDVRTEHRPMPGHLTEDNQPVTKLATTPETVMEDGTDCNSRLKMDKTYSDTAMSKSSPALPGETAVVSLGAAFGPDTGKPSVHLVHGHLFTAEMYLEDNRRQTQSDNNGPVQTSVSQEGKAKRDNAFLPRAAESAFRFTEASNSPLECGQETVRDVPAYYSARLPCTERDVHCTGMSNEIPAENSHIIVSWPSIKDRARLNELPSKEDSSSNFSGKKADQFTSEGRFLVTAVDKSTEGKFKEKRTELDVNVQSDGNCGIYHVLTGDNSTDFQAIPDTGNYSYHVQEHNSVAAIAGWDRPEDTNIKGPGFEASYKGKFLSEVPLESNKEENAISQERSGCRTTAEQTAPESENILEILPPDSQQRISGGKPGIASAVCAVEKGMRTDITCLTPDSENAVAIVIGKECSNSGQDASNILGLVYTHKRNEEDENEGCSVKAVKTKSTLGENLMSAEPMQMEVERDMSKQTPGPGQDLSQRMEEERKTHAVPYERETGQTQIPISHDFEEAEVEPYMRALVDPKVQIYSWVDSMELQQIEHQKPKDEKQIPIPSRERNARKSQEPLECDLEGVEVEPYNRVLLNSKGIYSWHEGTDYVDPSRGRTEVSVEACVRTSTSHHQADAITTDVSNIPNMSEHTMEASVHIVPCTSENRPYSQKKFPSPLSDPPLKEERARLQETSKLCKASLAHRSPEGMKQNQDTVKKKVMPKVQSKKPRLDVKENTCNKVGCIKKVSKEETGQKDEKKEQRKPPSRKESKAPKLLKKIQAELFPDFSGNIKLCCQFVEIHDDATITWTKDSQLLARAHRSARDELPVSLAILQADKKDQGLYCCCLKNKYGKATADFNLTSEVLEHVASFQDAEGLEEIEFSQLMFREDFICDRYFSSSLHGRITTEELHFGEGVHRKAFRSKVMQGLVPMFSPGHPCVLKVHNAISHGTKTNDELVKRNYKLALQECCVQNTAREYAKIYAAETKLLEDFGEVPEIIPIFLIHRPQSNVPYATVEEELIGEFVKYSIRDGKEINFKRRDSEAGQKCCTFQHWVYERTNGGLLITDMQGVGMKLTDVGIATLAKGYKGFKGNCSISFIDQFKALHQCNKYCEMLGLKPLQTSHQKQKKPVLPKSKTQQPSSSTLKKTVVGAQAAKKT